MVFLNPKIMALINFVNPATKYKWFNTLWIASMLMFPFLLWLMPADYFDHGGVEICPSKAFFNLECPGCGLTRATMHMHHMEWQEAIYFNTGIVVIYPALVIVWAWWFFKAIQRQRNFAKAN